MTKDNIDQIFIMTNQSSYFLHPLDSPTGIITTIKFDGRNYDLWEKAVITSLESKNKLGFIDGSITKPETKDGVVSDKGRAWEMVNSIVVSWIMNVIDPRLHKSVAYVENIKNWYDVPNICKIH